MTAEDLEPMLMKTVVGVGHNDECNVTLIVLADAFGHRMYCYLRGTHDFDIEGETREETVQ